MAVPDPWVLRSIFINANCFFPLNNLPERQSSERTDFHHRASIICPFLPGTWEKNGSDEVKFLNDFPASLMVVADELPIKNPACFGGHAVLAIIMRFVGALVREGKIF